MRKARTTHPEEQKTRALAIYAETGSSHTASEETGIPRRTIDSWITSDPEIDAKLEALRRAIREKTAHTFAEVSAVSARELLDRLQNGDDIVDNKTGSVLGKRRVQAKDLAIISSIAAENHARITGPLAKQTSAERKLVDLADALIATIEKTARVVSPSKAAPIDVDVSECGKGSLR